MYLLLSQTHTQTTTSCFLHLNSLHATVSPLPTPTTRNLIIATASSQPPSLPLRLEQTQDIIFAHYKPPIFISGRLTKPNPASHHQISCPFSSLSLSYQGKEKNETERERAHSPAPLTFRIIDLVVSSLLFSHSISKPSSHESKRLGFVFPKERYLPT